MHQKNAGTQIRHYTAAERKPQTSAHLAASTQQRQRYYLTPLAEAKHTHARHGRRRGGWPRCSRHRVATVTVSVAASSLRRKRGPRSSRCQRLWRGRASVCCAGARGRGRRVSPKLAGDTPPAPRPASAAPRPAADGLFAAAAAAQETARRAGRRLVRGAGSTSTRVPLLLPARAGAGQVG